MSRHPMAQDCSFSRTWFFYNEHGRHWVLLGHDDFKGTRRIVVNGEQVVYVPRNLVDSGSTHKLDVQGSKCIIKIEARMKFFYYFLVDGQPFDVYMDQFWKKANKWRIFNAHTERWHFCVAYQPSTSSHIKVFFDGQIVSLESEFVESGSQHQFFVDRQGLVTDKPTCEEKNNQQDQVDRNAKRPHNLHCMLKLEGDSDITLIVDDQRYPRMADPWEGEHPVGQKGPLKRRQSSTQPAKGSPK